MVVDAILDRSHLGSTRTPRSACMLKQVCSSLGLIDAWRLLNPSGRDYTFFSSPHSTYSHIDYFFISKNIVPSLLKCTIGNILISDHAPVFLDLMPLDIIKRSYRWRLNFTLLHIPAFKDLLKEQIDFYLSTNLNSAPSVGVAWEALKAYVRGVIIQYASAKKKLEHNKLSELEGRIKEAENNLKQKMNHGNLRLLVQLKYQYNNILTQKVEFDFRIRQKSFESGDKAGKMLAR